MNNLQAARGNTHHSALDLIQQNTAECDFVQSKRVQPWQSLQLGGEILDFYSRGFFVKAFVVAEPRVMHSELWNFNILLLN